MVALSEPPLSCVATARRAISFLFRSCFRLDQSRLEVFEVLVYRKFVSRQHPCVPVGKLRPRLNADTTLMALDSVRHRWLIEHVLTSHMDRNGFTSLLLCRRMAHEFSSVGQRINYVIVRIVRRARKPQDFTQYIIDRE